MHVAFGVFRVSDGGRQGRVRFVRKGVKSR
jgi:hypothetical protein